MTKLKPCPFCGKEIDIQITDDEGNLRDDSYIDDPWSGLSFAIKHYYEKDNICPIATHKNEIVGCTLYESEKELKQAWNNRSHRTTANVRFRFLNKILTKIASNFA